MPPLNSLAGSDLKELCSAAMQECVAADAEGAERVLNLKHFEAASRWMAACCLLPPAAAAAAAALGASAALALPLRVSAYSSACVCAGMCVPRAPPLASEFSVTCDV